MCAVFWLLLTAVSMLQCGTVAAVAHFDHTISLFDTTVSVPVHRGSRSNSNSSSSSSRRIPECSQAFQVGSIPREFMEINRNKP